MTVGLGIAIFLGLCASPSLAFQDEKAAWLDEGQSFKYGQQGAAPCQDGLAAGFPCSNVHLLNFMPLSDLGTPPGGGLNDAWGWTDPETNQVYALVGREDGMAFVDMTDPLAPIFKGEMLRTKTALPHAWRDVKVDGNYAFVLADGSSSQGEAHGMQVVDLRKLRAYSGTPLRLQADALYSDFTTAHNIAINEESHRAYIVGARGSSSCGVGLQIVDISIPLEPKLIGCFADTRTGRAGTGYTHDTQCVIYRGPDSSMQGREICFSSNETAISISDVTDSEAPIAVAKGTYPGSAYIHQGWLTEDQRYFIQNDELDERAGFGFTRTMIWDVSVLDEPFLLDVFTSTVTSIDHNLYIREGLAYQANYTSGLRILDVRNPSNVTLLGSFDTTPGNDDVSFAGTWTAYPFPDSDVVVLTSRKEGLFIVRPSDIVGTRIESTSHSVNNDQVTFQWTTTHEQNVTEYAVEQVLGDGTFRTLASVPATGGVLQTQSYETTIDLDEGVFLFRISAHSEDGGFVFRNEGPVVSMKGQFLLDDPYPNPSSSLMRTHLAVSKSQTIVIDGYDVGGRRVISLFQGNVDRLSPLNLAADISSLKAGIYFMRITGETFSTTKEFVVAR